MGLVVWQWKHIAKTPATVNDGFAGHFRLRPYYKSGEVDFGFNLSSDIRTGGGEAGVEDARGAVVVTWWRGRCIGLRSGEHISAKYT